MPLTVDPARRLDPLTETVLRAIDDAAKTLGLAYFVCGALARDILTWHVHGIRSPRATRDIDLAFSVPDWTQFTRLKSCLIETGQFVGDLSTGKLRFQDAAGGRGYPIDLIPFGGVAGAKGIVTWPPEHAVELSVVGYEEALRSACRVRVSEHLEVPVLSLPMLAALKILAWKDRMHLTSKDAEDFAFLLSKYEYTGARDRLFDDHIPILESVAFDLESGSAYLLGRDVGQTVDPRSHAALTATLDEKYLRDSMITQIAASLRGRPDPITVAEALLQQFELGLTGTVS